MTATDVLPEGFDFTDPDVNQKAIPHDEFRAARQNAPIHWIEQAPGASAAASPRSRAPATGR